MTHGKDIIPGAAPDIEEGGYGGGGHQAPGGSTLAHQFVGDQDIIISGDVSPSRWCRIKDDIEVTGTQDDMSCATKAAG